MYVGACRGVGSPVAGARDGCEPLAWALGTDLYPLARASGVWSESSLPSRTVPLNKTALHHTLSQVAPFATLQRPGSSAIWAESVLVFTSTIPPNVLVAFQCMCLANVSTFSTDFPFWRQCPLPSTLVSHAHESYAVGHWRASVQSSLVFCGAVDQTRASHVPSV